MVNGIVQCVRPKGRLILKDGHRGVVGEVLLKKHLKLFVSASLKEGRSHAANVGLVDAAVQVQNLALTCRKKLQKFECKNHKNIFFKTYLQFPFPTAAW